jgi:ABC-type branched-subunit amino acid transport system permease subunit
MAFPGIPERIAAAAVGVVFGCVIGFALAWLVGIYSNTAGPGEFRVSFANWALGGAMFFGGIGALFGSSVGTLIGNVIAAIFGFERGSEEHVPWWLVVVLLGAAVAAVLWFTRSSA